MSEKESFQPDDTNELVPVVFARDEQEAEVYCELLEDHEIPATMVGDEYQETLDADAHSEYTHGVAVLVPEIMLEEAGAIVAQRQESSSLLEDFDEFGDEEDEEYDSESMTDLDDMTDLDEEEDDVLADLQDDEEIDDDEDQTDLEAFKEAFGDDLLDDELLDDLDDDDIDDIDFDEDNNF